MPLFSNILLKTFRGGVHPPQLKTTPADTIIEAHLPRRVSLALRQHIGAEAVAIVKLGEHLRRGQMVAQAPSVVSAPVHTPISGTVRAIGPVAMLNGRHAAAITIEASDDDAIADIHSMAVKAKRRNIDGINAEEIVAAITEAGIVGLGGATFPTPVKLTPTNGMRPELLIINACECEPALTCDDALMRSVPGEIVEGTALMMRAANVHRAIIAIEDNKPEAYRALCHCVDERDDERITVQRVATKYPQGGEKQLIYALTGKEVPSGALPITTGCIVNNVATAYAVQQAVVYGRPLIDRVVTLYGIGNFRMAIGTYLSDPQLLRDIPQHTPLGAILHGTEPKGDIVAGGPMMGASVARFDAPIVKGTAGITMCQPLGYDPQPCLRCAACVDACPMGLEPYLIATYARYGKMDDARDAGARDCMECGCCSYSCPSARPIVDYIRLAKRSK